MIIEKQKFQINQLREQVREQEAKERHRLMTRFEDGDVVALKMQEYQYENATLKAQIAELASTKNMDVDQFSRKLGQTEYELEETKAALRELALDKKKGLEDIRKQLNDKEEHIMDLSSEYKRVRDKYEKLKNRKDSLERYLEDLPTAEEHLKKSDEISFLYKKIRIHNLVILLPTCYLKHLKDKDSILSEKISQLEKLLSASKKTIRSKDIKMSALESKYSDMKIEVESLQDKLNKVTQKKLRTDGDANTSIDDDIDELKFQRDQLNAECERLKKLVESKHNKQKSMQAQHRVQIQQVEERLQQEEDTVTALREALSSKEESMKKIQISMKELATQSQEMYEHNLNLQEKVQEYEQSLTSETMKVYNKLMKEMTACIVDLRGITQICTQRAEGKDPNISMLLGLRSSSVACEYEEDVDPTSVETMKHKLIQIREMRQEIEKLRTLISDKYAEDIGDNCITQ
ncbi:centrosomal protein of 85 kDa-like [Glandiceps talaboti]